MGEPFELAAAEAAFLDAQDSAIYVVRFGTALDANDVTVAAMAVGSYVYVVPEADFAALRRTRIVKSAKARRAIFEVAAWTPPADWRKRRFGILPSTSIVKGRYPRRQLDELLQTCPPTVFEGVLL